MIDPKPTAASVDPPRHGGLPGERLPVHPGAAYDPASLEYDARVFPPPPPHLTCERLEAGGAAAFLETKGLYRSTTTAAMTMLRIAALNIMLHGIKEPNIQYTDTLGKAFERGEELAGESWRTRPFQGRHDSGDVSETLPSRCKNTDRLFVHLFLRCSLWAEGAPPSCRRRPCSASAERTSSPARSDRRDRLEAVISIAPIRVFKPYAGVPTSA